MKVLVVGASGVVGAELVPQLVECGHEVVGTTRKRERLGDLRALGAEPVLLDGLDATAVGETVARVAPEAIVNEMTAISGTPDLRHFDRWFAKTNELRTRGADNLLAAARASGVRRFITQSYTGWTNDDSGDLVKTEADPLDPDPLPGQRETLAAIATMESNVLNAPLEGIVLRYANLYGPHAIGQSLEVLRKRQWPIVGDGGGVWSWVHVHDAAAATVASLERAAPGIYNIADDEPAPVREWLPYLAEVIGAPKPMRVPAWLGRLLAGDVAVRWMTRGRGASNAKAKTELGWQLAWSSWREGFHTLVDAANAVRRHDDGVRDVRAGATS